MTKFEVVFYEEENGDCPVEEFINSPLIQRCVPKWSDCLNCWKKKVISLENHTVNCLMMEYLKLGVLSEII